MPYIATIPVIFPCSRSEVYRALCDLERYPLWNSGMRSISTTERLRLGLRYKTESTVAGHVNVSELEVMKLVPNETIELASKSGLIAYDAVFKISERGPDLCEVICTLKFEFRHFMLDVARPAIETMAQARVRGDLETLRAMLSHG